MGERRTRGGPTPGTSPTPDGGYDGDRTISITVPTSCLATGGDLADTVRVSAANDAHRSGNDHTEWTAQVTRD